MRYEIILDTGETANKCTIAPLRDRPDFRLIRVQGAQALGPLSAPILLHHEGECLTRIRASAAPIDGIASIDCVWKRLGLLVDRVEGRLPRLARIPDGFETAYPRRSVKNTDPDGGLATIEAIFVAAALLGRWDASLLSRYYFGRRFVEMNRKRLLELGVAQAGDDRMLPVLEERPRSSAQRRMDRSSPWA